MRRYEYVPEEVIPKLAKLTNRKVEFRLSRLSKFKLIQRWTGPYTGYALSSAGYDTLAINALVKVEVLEALGKPLGVGKESDVYGALTPEGRQVAVKFHRLGRTSFRQTRRVRGYIAQRRHISWLYQSRLGAEKEFEALKLLYPQGVAVPEPLRQNRHLVVMGMIEGAELVEYKEIHNPKEVLDETLSNLRQAYLKVGVIHADLSEFNIILQPSGHVLIIDWPQYVRTTHPNAERLLERDVRNVTRFFTRKFKVKIRLVDAVAYVKATT